MKRTICYQYIYEPSSIIDVFNETRRRKYSAIRWPRQDYESYNALSNSTGKVGINVNGNNFNYQIAMIGTLKKI